MRLSKNQINIMMSIFANTARSRNRVVSCEDLLGKSMNRLIQKGFVKFDHNGYRLTPQGMSVVSKYFG